LARDGFAALRDASFAEDAKSIFSSMSSLWFVALSVWQQLKRLQRLEKSGEEQCNVFSAESDLQLWPISDISSCIIGLGWGICEPCKWVKLELEF
jgi:hypothetical protein